MKLLGILNFALVILFIAPVATLAASVDHARMVLVPIAFDPPLIPTLDPSTEAKLTVTGQFRSGCERAVKTEVENLDGRTHVVRAAVLTLVDYACSRVEREFEHDVSLGYLAEGPHRLITEGFDGALTVISFTVAKP